MSPKRVINPFLIANNYRFNRLIKCILDPVDGVLLIDKDYLAGRQVRTEENYINF